MADQQTAGSDPTPGYLHVLAQHVRKVPDQIALHRVAPTADGFDAQPMSFASLAGYANGYAQLFRDRGLGPGDRVLLSLADPRQLIGCLIGAMSQGIVTVPLQTHAEFRGPALFRERMHGVAADCRPSLVVVESLEAWRGAIGETNIEAPVVEASEVAADFGSADELHTSPQAGDTPAVIQYTSGSTGTPRGVVVTHGNIAANIRAIATTSQSGSGDRFFSWLPLHHDMGLIGGLLFPIYWRMPAHIMSAIDFMTRPVTWLRGIHHFRASMTVGPTFAYSLCWRKIPDTQLDGLDLSSCRLAFCGAEPIEPAVARGFVERFAAYGLSATCFYPVYGLAEATLAVSFPQPGDEVVVDVVDRTTLAADQRAKPTDPGSKTAASFVSVGQALAEHSAEVVDPETRAPCAERQVGEIVARGPSVSPRYFDEDPKTQRTALRTGDLGYVADGRLYVIDRIKDLIIIAGQNFAPSDLEPCAAATVGVRLGRVVAFSLPGDNGTESLHFVAELDPRSWRSQDAIRAELCTRVQRAFGLRVEGVALVPPGSIPRTSSGKLKRRACRDRYRLGEYGDSVPLRTRLALKWAPLVQLVRAGYLPTTREETQR